MLRALCFCLCLCLPLPAIAQEEGIPTPAGQVDAMFQLAQRVQGGSAARAVQQIALRLAARAEGAEALALERRDLEERQAQVAGEPGLDEATRAIRLDELETALFVNAERLARSFPRWREITAPAPVTLAEARGLLAEGEALVLLHQGEDALFLWLVAPDRVIWHRVGIPRADAAGLVAAFREGMGLGEGLRGAAALDDDPAPVSLPPFNRQLAANLYILLFGAFAAEMGDYSHLRLVADDAWIGLPFAALLTSYDDVTAPEGHETLRHASWLARSHALTLMPSVVSLRALSAAPPAPSLPTLLAVGDPVFSGAASAMEVSRAGGGVDVSALAPLPGTRREVTAIARQFDGRAEVLLGADASETAIRTADLASRDVIVFATHGLIAGELQGLAEPALALTPPAAPGPADDGLLTAGEIAGLTLSADWVVLSACNTAAGDGAGAEGLSGLARAFFAAGAQSLLVSHWPVRDDAAARLTSGAFAEMAADPALPKAEALRRSMLHLMADESDPTLAHPRAWAPFFVVGGGA
ncbi:CHAT domain-containing protein [Mesobacterium pallidum]|uniref:CHAT domain-containing protein n=1 Tax=Mesobacterium pallidum TaxID=2872037 RepID=UPI001EE1A9EB|nr:CHAT domain-containing protein [Mesobacterium pallidum]